VQDEVPEDRGCVFDDLILGKNSMGSRQRTVLVLFLIRRRENEGILQVRRSLLDEPCRAAVSIRNSVQRYIDAEEGLVVDGCQAAAVDERSDYIARATDLSVTGMLMYILGQHGI
jgi:hypothetical protein